MNVINHLSALESAGLVNLVQVTPDLEYLFRHTLVQEAAYASLLQADQKRLHRQVGEALESLYPDQLDELSPVLARHFERAGVLPKAEQYYERAGKAALKAYASREAAAHFQNALRLAHEETQCARLLSSLGEAQYLLSQFEEAVQTWRESVEIYRKLGEVENVARLFARMGRAAWFKNFRQGLDLCQEGLSAVGDSPESYGLALLLHETARAYYFNGQARAALPLCRQALEMAQRLELVDVQAEALSTLGLLPDLSDEERMEALSQAVELAEAEGLLGVAARAHINLGSAQINQLGDKPAGLKHYLRAVELCQRSGITELELYARLAAVGTELMMGNLADVDHALQIMESLYQSLDEPGMTEFELRRTKISLAGMRGQWDEALRDSSRCLQRAKERQDHQNYLISAYQHLEILFELNRLSLPVDLEAGAVLIQECLDLMDGIELQGSKAILYGYLAYLRAQQGRFDETQPLLEQGKALATDELHKEKFEMVWNLLLMEIAALQHEWDQALQHFAILSKQREKMETWLWARILVEAAKIRLLRADPEDLEEAQGMLLEARDWFAHMHSQPYIDLAERWLQTSRSQTYAQAALQRRVAQELDQASRVQSSFLPIQPPKIAGWQIAVTLRSARQTTGDYYDFIPLPGGNYGIVIADVADKGMGAALVMTSSRTLLRAYAAEHPEAPEQVLLKANQRITQDTHGSLFVTLFYGVLNPANGNLHYCNAGHNPPYLWLPGKAAQLLTRTGVPLGVFADASWETRRVILEPGGVLVLYTDGVTEAAGPDEQLFGESRLIEAVQKAASSSESAQEMQDKILAQIDGFRNGASLSDDLTLVLLARR